VAPYIFVAGAICTAVAVELLLAQLDTGAFWCLLPWLIITAVVVAVPVLRRATSIWRDNQEDFARMRRALQKAIAARWRQFFAH
jgi:hypothetical protein